MASGSSRHASWLAAICAAIGIPACPDRAYTPIAYVPDPTAAAARLTGDRVVLVTIDGARWQDVFEGSDATWGPRPPVPPEAIVPRSYELARTRGVMLGATRPGCGILRTAGGANVSLPGYREIFTAHPSRCMDNGCSRVAWTVLDEAAQRGVPGVASIGSWEGLAMAVSGGDRVLVSAGRRWPGAARGALAELVGAASSAGPFPGHGHYRPDRFTAAVALEYIRAESPALLHVGLGDTDEYGHRADYDSYLAALHAADALVGGIVDLLDARGLMRETTILVTPDHGRNDNFRDHGTLGVESGRTFLFAFGDRIAARGIGCPRRDVTLADLAPTIAALLGLPPDTSPEAGRPIEAIVTPPLE